MSVTRRDFLLGAGAAASAPALAACSDDGRAAAPRTTAASPTTAAAGAAVRIPADQRLLVVVELPGGNDGLSTLVPYEDGHYHDVRPTVALDADEVVDLGDGLGLNRTLADWHDDRFALLAGVGARTPSLSHFDMMARWWAGTPDANTSGGTGTGFVGRLSDRLGAAGSLTAVSVALLGSPAIRNRRRTAVGLPDNSTLGTILGGDPVATAAFHDALAALGAAGTDGAADDPATAVAQNLTRMLSVDAALTELPPPAPGYDLSDPVSARFSAQMSFAGQLLRSDAGIRIVHVTADGVFFDTHERHREMNAVSLAAIAPGLTAFRRELAEAGLTDRVLIATTSEFGRRVEEHNGGLDHGTASTMMLMGPVRPGLHGELPSLRRLDVDGNLRPSLSFDRYLATLAAWMDVDPASVLDARPKPIDGLLAV